MSHDPASCHSPGRRTGPERRVPDLHHDPELEAARADLVRSGLRASVASIGWTVAASGTSVVLGASSGSVVLVAFGAVGFCDAAGSTSLVVHFRHALRHQAISDRHEQISHRIVLAGLLIVGVATAAGSTVRLVLGGRASEPLAGIVVSAASIFVLALLARWKRVVAQEIPSAALFADSWLSLVGSVIASVAVIGTVFDRAWGWWWIDPGAALLIAIGAIAVAGTNAARAARTAR